MFNFAAENITQTQESGAPQHRANTVENEEAAEAHLKNARERRSHGAKPGKELSEDQGTSALLRENAFGAANAGIRLDRNLAKELKHSDAFAQTQLIPEGIGANRGKCDNKQGRKNIQLMGACERAGREQEGQRRHGHSRLFGEDPGEQNDIAMVEKELDGAMHLAGTGPLSMITDYRETIGEVCPQRPDMTNSVKGLRVRGACSRSCSFWGREPGSPG